MATQSHSLFDRVAIAFGAMVVGFSAALVVALPLLFVVGMISSTDLSNVGASLFFKIPILFGLVSGVAGFISPAFSADWLGKTWKGVIYVWRGFVGS